MRGYIIGFVQLIKRVNSVEIGYSIKERFQGNGYGTKVLAHGIKLAYEHRENIIVRIRDDNIVFQKVAVNHGFVKTDIYISRYT